MFNIETVEDVKILRELTKNNDNERIKALEQEVFDLKEVVKNQNSIISELKEAENPLTKADVVNLIAESIKGTKKTVPKKRVSLVKKDKSAEFTINPSLFKHKIVSPYHKIFVQGNTLIHKAASNHENELPVSTIQFLLIVEKFIKSKNKISVKDAQTICNLCDISKQQFAKIYYNLKEGRFFEAIDTIDTQIKQTTFMYKNGFIHIKKGTDEFNTGIDKKTYDYLINVYVNSNTPYLTIYKLSKEYPKINPIFLLTVLRRNVSVSKLLGEKQ